MHVDVIECIFFSLMQIKKKIEKNKIKIQSNLKFKWKLLINKKKLDLNLKGLEIINIFIGIHLKQYIFQLTSRH